MRLKTCVSALKYAPKVKCPFAGKRVKYQIESQIIILKKVKHRYTNKDSEYFDGGGGLIKLPL